jgi:hypothetical protein
VAEYPEHKAGPGREATSLEELLPSSLESAAVAHPGRTRRLAAAASKAGVEVLEQGGIMGVHLASLERAHEYDPSPWAMALVSGDQVGGASR